jgi:hypothetical protein
VANNLSEKYVLDHLGLKSFENAFHKDKSHEIEFEKLRLSNNKEIHDFLLKQKSE